MRNLLILYFAIFASSLSALKFNQLELKDSKVISFSSCSKVGQKALKVVTVEGKLITILREELSDAEVIRRFGTLIPLNYGKAYYQKSKLPEDFDAGEFRKTCLPLIELLKKDRLDDKWWSIKMDYYYFVPEAHSATDKKAKNNVKFPLVVFLHGMGDVNKLAKHPQCLI